MTPDKCKRPLPSSTFMALPDQAKTFQHWQAALRRIKVLYLGGHWKQCTARSIKLFSEAKSTLNPLHATYIHFYSALSNEAIARHTHDLSAMKVHTLNQAKVSYLAAAACLPIADRDIDEDCDRESAFTDTSSASEESAILDYYHTNRNVLDPLGYATSPSSIDSNDTIIVRRIAPSKPSPLKLCRELSFTNQQTGELMHLSDFPTPPDTPRHLRQLPAPPDTPPFTPPPRSTSLQASSDTVFPSNNDWLPSRAYERYNAHLTSFSDMLAKHIQIIDTLIWTTRQAQATSQSLKQIKSCSDDEEAKMADLKARIKRLKEAGWRRERFAPGKYQDICEEALAEL